MKRRHYVEDVKAERSRGSLKPFIMEIFGAFGRTVKKVMTEIHFQGINSGLIGAARLVEIKYLLSVTLQRGNAMVRTAGMDGI